MVFEENEPGMWKPENDGDNITGVLLKTQDDVGANKSKLYSLEVSWETKKEIMNVWGSTILDARMIGMNPGDLIRITYKGLGEATGGHNAPKIFKVERDNGKEEVAEVTEEKI